MDESWKSAIAEMSRDEITARFLALSFPEVFAERNSVEVPQPAANTRSPWKAPAHSPIQANGRRERDEHRERVSITPKRPVTHPTFPKGNPKAIDGTPPSLLEC